MADEKLKLAMNPLPMADIADLEIRAHTVVGIQRAKYLARINTYVKKNPGKYDEKLISLMQRVGIKRPEWIPKDVWSPTGRKRNEARDRLICMMAAHNTPIRVIAESVGMNPPGVGRVLKDNKPIITSLKEKIWGGDPKKILETILPQAIRTAKDIMDDEGVKAQTRLAAAQDFMDRNLGKAAQKVEIEHTNLRQLMERLDRADRSGELPDIIAESRDVPEPGLPAPVEEKEEPKDEVDQWIEEHL